MSISEQSIKTFLNMDHLLVLLLLLGSSGLQVEGNYNSIDSVRLVGGGSRCEGTLEVKKGEWRPVSEPIWTLRDSAVVCKQLDCGSAVTVEWKEESSDIPVWKVRPRCVSTKAMTECVHPGVSSSIVKITCTDSVRLEDGISLCSGRLEVKSNNRWSQVCEANFDQQDAEVVCRELGCGAPSVVSSELFGEIKAHKLTNEYQCIGSESSLMDCSVTSGGSTCSAGAAGLICSEPVRLVNGSSRCDGALEVKHGDWRAAVMVSGWNLRWADIVCRELDCGTAVSVDQRMEFPTDGPAWNIRSECVQAGSALKDCATPYSTSSIVNLTCSNSVKLVDGTSLCSGRLKVKSNNRWSSVCDADFDQQDAEVACRELGCGAPSVLQGAPDEEDGPVVWTNVFDCVGSESALLDCQTSGSVRNTCSPGKAVGLTCSESMRLVGGSSRCAGTLEFKRGEWRPVTDQHFDWTLEVATVVCGHLNCGSAVSVGQRLESSHKASWFVVSSCVQSGSDLRSCAKASYSKSMLVLNCSG